MRLEEYAKLVRGKICHWCHAELPVRIKHYDHSSGWTVEGFAEKQWLYVRCPKCHYDFSLWKLGVPRENLKGEVEDEARGFN